MTSELLGVIASNLRWFESDGSIIAIDRSKSTALGELAVPRDEEHAVMDLIDAVLLNEQDPLLRCIDDWCNSSFKWRPWRQPQLDPDSDLARRQASGAPILLHELPGYPRPGLSLTSLQGTPRAVLLAIDADTFEQMPPLPEAWQSLVKLQSFLRRGSLHLQTLRLSMQEKAKLAPGSLMLLPHSFESVWQANLIDLATDSLMPADGIAAEVDVEENRIRLLAGRHAEPQAGNAASQVSESSPDESVQPAQANSAQTPPDKDPADMEQGDTSQQFNTVTVQLKQPLQFNDLYTLSVWQAQLNMALSLPGALHGAPVVLRQHAEDGRESGAGGSLAGQLWRVGRGYGVLLQDDES